MHLEVKKESSAGRDPIDRERLGDGDERVGFL
jgi:hypothetical protein